MSNSRKSMAVLPWIAAIAFFMQTLDATILNTALPAIANSLQHSPLAMQSVVISYILAVAMLIPVSGWLADRFGTKKIFIIAVILFSLGSLLCSLSSTLTTLVISRIVQGIGGAMMMPVARLTLLRAYPRNELLSVLNLVTIPGLIGPVIGPVLGGWLVTYATWHWIFLINIPIGIIGIICAYRYMPNYTMPRTPFDFLGFLLFSFSLVLLTIGIDSIGEQIFSSYFSVILIIFGFLFLFFYAVHAKKYPSPLIDLGVFKIQTFTIGIAGNIFSRLGTGCIPFLIPLLLQVGFGHSAFIAGTIMLPIAIGSILAKSVVTQILSYIGYKKTLIVITASIGIAIMQFSVQSPTIPLLLLLISLFVLGGFMAIQFTAMNTLTLGELTDRYTSMGNSTLAVTQQLSISFGVAISAAVLRFYDSITDSTETLTHFHYTFLTMGAITLLSATIFLCLRDKAGEELLRKSKET